MKKPVKNQKEKTSHFSFFIFLVLIVVIPNLLDRSAMDQQLVIRMLGLSLFLGILFLPLILIKKSGSLKSADLRILKNPAVIVYGLLIFIIGISYFWATNQSEAIYELLKRAVFFILFLYLILFVLPEKESRLSLIKAFILFAFIISLTGIFQMVKVYAVSKYSIDSLYLITGNFAQKNIFSEVLFITFAFCLYGIVVLDKIWEKAAIAAALLSFLLIAFLMTRAIWAGFIVSLLVTFVLYVVYVGKTLLNSKIKSVLRYFVIIFGVIVIGLVIAALADKNKTLQHQISNAFDFKQGNTFHRLNLWKKTLSLAEKHPITGVGAGNWRIEILQYDLQVTTDKGRIMPDRTHNDYLQMLAENGIIGLVLFLSLFGILLYFCILTLKKANHFQDSFFMLILFFALAGYMVDSSFAFPRERIELQIFLNIIFAFIVYEFNSKFKKEMETKTQISIKPFALILFLVLMLCSFAAYKRLQAEEGMTKIYAYNKLNNHEQIIKITNDIYSPFSTISPFNDPILQIRAVSMYQTKKDLNQVLETFDNSMKDSPYHLETLNGLSMIYNKEKEYTKAMEFNEKALKYAPSDIRARVIRSDIFLSMDKMDEAYQNLKKIDTTNNNTEYKRALKYILLNKIRVMMSQTKNEYFSMQLSKALDRTGFLFKTYCKSINKNEEFEKTLLETVFTVCDQDKINKDPSIQQLKRKYGCSL